MTDIVDRLRQRPEHQEVFDHLNRPYGLDVSLEHQAADEIERLRAERDMWRQENLKKQIACEQMGARIVALEAERDEAIERGNDWCNQTKKARVERDVARREGIKAAAREVDCSCEVRDAVLARLKARDLTRASWLCQHGDVCCALQAAEILDLLEDEQ